MQSKRSSTTSGKSRVAANKSRDQQGEQQDKTWAKCFMCSKDCPKLHAHLMRSHTKKDLVDRIMEQPKLYNFLNGEWGDGPPQVRRPVLRPCLVERDENSVDNGIPERINPCSAGLCKIHGGKGHGTSSPINIETVSPQTTRYVYLCQYCPHEFEMKNLLEAHQQSHLDQLVQEDVLSLEQDYSVDTNRCNELYYYYGSGYHHGKHHAGEALKPIAFYSIYMQDTIGLNRNGFQFFCNGCSTPCNVMLRCNDCVIRRRTVNVENKKPFRM